MVCWASLPDGRLHVQERRPEGSALNAQTTLDARSQARGGSAPSEVGFAIWLSSGLAGRCEDAICAGDEDRDDEDRIRSKGPSSAKEGCTSAMSGEATINRPGGGRRFICHPVLAL